MPITFIGSREGSVINGGDVTLTVPGGLATDDLVVVAYAIGDNDNLDFTMAMVTAGYTKVADLFANDAQDCNLGVFWKIMGATPDTSVVVDGQGGTDAAVAAVAMFFRGVDTTTPMDVTPTTATAINTMHPNPPSIDHLNPAGLWTVIAGASGHTLAGAGTYTFPTGYTTDAIDRGADDTSDVTVGMGYRTNPADPEDPGVMTHSGADSTSFANCAATLALRPAAPQPALLEGSIGMTATLVGALTTAITMAGSILAQAAAAAVLTTQITLGGAVAGQMAPAAALTTEIRLAGQVAGQLVPSGDLTAPQQALLEGQIAGTLQVAGEITTEIRLAGTVAGSATLGGDLEAGSGAPADYRGLLELDELTFISNPKR